MNHLVNEQRQKEPILYREDRAHKPTSFSFIEEIKCQARVCDKMSFSDRVSVNAKSRELNYVILPESDPHSVISFLGNVYDPQWRRIIRSSNIIFKSISGSGWYFCYLREREKIG